MKYYEEIFKVINEICYNSEIGESIDFVKKGHRRINVKSHIVFLDSIKNYLHRQNITS